jgi:hypothetical protein
MNYKLELTEEEIKFIYDRCFNKANRLEEIGLDDVPYYRIAHQIMHKIYVVKNNNNFSIDNTEQIYKEEDKD